MYKNIFGYEMVPKKIERDKYHGRKKITKGY